MAAASSECESPHMHRRSRLSRALKPSHGACLQQASLKAEPAPRVRASASGARPGACCALPPLRRRRGGGSRRPGAAPLRRGGERAERGPARPRGPPRGWPSARLTGSGGGSRGRLPPAGERGGRGAGAAAAAAEPLRAGNPAGLRRRARLPRGYREEESGSGKGCGPRGRNEGIARLLPTAVERRNMLDTCLLKPAFESLLDVDKIYPFLCANDFIRAAEFHGSDKFELPYGIKRAEQFFRLALSRLQNCGLSNEDDSVSCRRCVVVGNGGVLRNKTLGEKIDSYDVIIRMNNGPVIGYEEDVGRRTTFRLSYPESIFSDPIHYDPNTTVVIIVFKPRDLKWLWEILGGQKISAKGFWKKPALNMIYKSNQIRILDPSITRKTAYDWLHFPTRFPKKEKPKHPTTGLIAITLAFHICHEVHLAGFKYDFTDRNSSLHYYGNDTMSQMMQNEYHDISAEQKFLKKLIDKNFVVNLT
nr:type 2 lactosamine alpha-2,3-sialyltransferase isoform X1 [Anas platyrhynchos]